MHNGAAISVDAIVDSIKYIVQANISRDRNLQESWGFPDSIFVYKGDV